MSQLHVSQEYLTPSADLKMFGATLFGVVEKLCEDTGSEPSGKSIAEVIKQHTGLSFDVQFTEGAGPAVFGVGLAFEGHTGTDAGVKAFLNAGGTGGKKHTLTVDLAKGRVFGEVTKYPSVLFFPKTLLTDGTFTPEEITAFILHEVGHVFFSLVTLGDYVRLNYCLTEGMEVLTGKKPNRYQIQLLDQEYLENIVEDEALAKRLANEPTESDLRRAVLLGHEKQRRHQLGSTLGSNRRSEQTADWYVSRVGFSRPLATGIAKITKAGRTARYHRSTPHHLSVEIIKTLTLALGLTVSSPALVVYALLENRDGVLPERGRYDNPKQRVDALRRDLIAQIRLTQPNESLHATLLEDYKAVERVLDTLKDQATITEALVYLFYPPHRRDMQRQAHEMQLETLLNNRLFFQAARFRT